MKLRQQIGLRRRRARTAPGVSTALTFTLVVTDAPGLPSAPDMVVITVKENEIYLPLVMRGN